MFKLRRARFVLSLRIPWVAFSNLESISEILFLPLSPKHSPAGRWLLRICKLGVPHTGPSAWIPGENNPRSWATCYWPQSQIARTIAPRTKMIEDQSVCVFAGFEGLKLHCGLRFPDDLGSELLLRLFVVRVRLAFEPLQLCSVSKPSNATHCPAGICRIWIRRPHHLHVRLYEFDIVSPLSLSERLCIRSPRMDLGNPAWRLTSEPAATL